MTGLSLYWFGHVLVLASARRSMPLCLLHIMHPVLPSSARRPMSAELPGEAWSGVLVGVGVQGLGRGGV